MPKSGAPRHVEPLQQRVPDSLHRHLRLPPLPGSGFGGVRIIGDTEAELDVVEAAVRPRSGAEGGLLEGHVQVHLRGRAGGEPHDRPRLLEEELRDANRRTRKRVLGFEGLRVSGFGENSKVGRQAPRAVHGLYFNYVEPIKKSRRCKA
eukprot:646784-Prorocentrum_minimum.AAC.2